MASLETLLTRYPAHIWRGSQATSDTTRLSTGWAALDKVLGGGWLQGDLTEILTTGSGWGELSLLMPVMAACTQSGGVAAWLPAETMAYAPALLQAGVSLDRLYCVATQDNRQRLWAAEQCLRSGACGVVLIAGLANVPDRSLRRLKLAAATGGSSAFLLRDASAARLASPAGLRLQVSRPANDLQAPQIRVLKCRGQATGTVHLQFQDGRYCAEH